MLRMTEEKEPDDGHRSKLAKEWLNDFMSTTLVDSWCVGGYVFDDDAGSIVDYRVSGREPTGREDGNGRGALARLALRVI